MKKLVVSLGIFGVLPLALLNSYLLDGITGLMLSKIFRENTEYSPNYSDQAFRKVKKGFSKDEVLNIIGEPLEKNIFDLKEYWYYARSPSDTHYKVRILAFNLDGKIQRKISEFYVD